MKEWQAFIETQAAELRGDNYICDASQLGLILVTGDDAETFLQNQLSNDISQLDESKFQFSSYSTPKGRMLGIFRVLRISNGYILITSISLLSDLLQRLQMYVVQSKVNLADASAHFSRFALQTDQPDILKNEVLPTNQDEVYQSDSLIVLNLGSLDGQNRFLVIGLSIEESKALWLSFCEHLQIGNFESWRLAEIKSGIPVIYPQTSEDFVAQMSNLNLIGGVNFKKGCYPGQEIVARMQYLGKLKRRMFLAEFDTQTCPEPGDELVSKGSDNVDGSGKIVDAVIDDRGRCLSLFIAQIKKAEADGLQLLDQPEGSYQLLDLPYSVEQK